MHPHHEKMVAFNEDANDDEACFVGWWVRPQGQDPNGWITKHLLLIAGEHGLSKKEWEEANHDWMMGLRSPKWRHTGREVLMAKATPHTESRYYYLKILSTEQRRELTDNAYYWRVY